VQTVLDMTTVQHEECVLIRHLGIVHDTNLKVGTKRRWTNLKSKPKKGEKMLISNDYALTYYPNRNQIVITLPQTSRTLTNTFSPVVDRRTDVKETDLLCLLQVIQVIFSKGVRREDEKKCSDSRMDR